MKLSKNVQYYGKDEPLPDQIDLKAGPLNIFYEAGDLRYIKYGDCLLYTSPSPRDQRGSRMPSSA